MDIRRPSTALRRAYIICSLILCTFTVQAQNYLPGDAILIKPDSVILGVMRIHVDTLPTSAIWVTQLRLWDSLRVARGLKAIFIVDANDGAIDSTDDGETKIYFPKYPVRDQWRIDGYVSFTNLASDSATFSFAFNQKALPTDGSWFYKFVIHTMKTGVASTSTTLNALPAIGSTDSLVLAVKVVSLGGQHYLSMNKYYTPGMASKSAPSLTGGTNMMRVQIANTLFPTAGTTVQLRITLWFIFRRF